MNETSLNYQQRFENLEEPTEFEKLEWFDPKVGQYEITFLSEAVPFIVKRDNKQINKIRIEIETNNKKMMWGVTEGRTKASLYGQIMAIAMTPPSNQLKGKKIRLLVKDNGIKRDYTIIEALDALGKPEEISV